MSEPGGARVLVVDDDPQMQRAVTNALRARGYSVFTAGDGETALEMLAAEQLDLVLLDLGLPNLDGREVIERLRAWSEIPVIVLSVRDGQDEKAAALDAGADDYITKPFGAKELLARMRAVLRRASPDQPEPILRFGELEIDIPRQLVKLDGNAIHLTPTEYRLLEAMVSSPGKLLTHGWLLQRVWGPGYATESHYLRLYVRQLRQKLNDDPSLPRWITTEPGVGYRWLQEPSGTD
ncbi:MAG: two-component system, OmpR family, operon response regulator KdpE [Actinomycetota bacterium]|jgi:two-component system KDP operon response regulator KdpE|nr:two-component system, OmpR family, operon response regulator KdpE [Actinomycetota bacterium]